MVKRNKNNKVQKPESLTSTVKKQANCFRQKNPNCTIELLPKVQPIIDR